MTISLIAIASVMAVSWAFGVVCDRIFTRWIESLKTPSDGGSEDPDIDLVMCKDCIFRDKTLFEEPCISCTGANNKREKNNK